jgi:hypothetical protein
MQQPSGAECSVVGLPFFVALLWFLFATDYAFQLLRSWRAAASGFALLVLCFGGIWAWFAGIPLVLRGTGLVCPLCRATPQWRLAEQHFALRTQCSGCGTKVFEEDWANAGNKG